MPLAPAWAEADEAEDDAPESEAPEDDAPDDDREVDETVEVRGRKRTAAEQARRAPESLVVVDLSEADPSDTLAEAVEAVPGTRVRRIGGAGDPVFVSIRGSSFQQVAVYVDGVPLNAFGNSAVDLAELDPAGIDRIELYRGYAPPHLGVTAVGGAINLVSDLDAPTRPRFQAGFGSWNTRQIRGDGGGKMLGGKGAWRASVGYLGTRGDYPTFSHNGTIYNRFDDRTVRRANNHSDRISGRVSLQADAGPVRFRLLEQASWSDGGVPGVFYAEARETRASVVQNLVHGRLTATLSPAATLEAGVGWRYRWDLYQDPLGEVGVGRQDQRSHRNAVNADVSAALRPLPWLVARPSARLAIDAFAPVELLDGRDEDGRRLRVASQFALDATARPLGDRLEVRASIGAYLLDHRFLGTVPFTDEPIVSDGAELLAFAQPGVAVALRPVEAITVHASASRGVRAPTFLELFGDRGTVVGNARLRPEVGNQVDGGVRFSGGIPGLEGSADLGGFYRRVDDLIGWVPNGQRVSSARNLGGAWIAGAELYGEATVGGVAFGAVSATLSDHRIVEGPAEHLGKQLPFVPTVQLDTTLGAAWAPYLRVSWTFRYVGRTWDTPSNLFSQAPRPLHDLHLRVQPGEQLPWIAVDLRNVADTTTATDFRNPLEPKDDDRTVVALQDFRGHPLPGRSVMITVGWTLDPPALRQAAQRRNR